jgi:hypothetical protein
MRIFLLSQRQDSEMHKTIAILHYQTPAGILSNHLFTVVDWYRSTLLATWK